MKDEIAERLRANLDRVNSLILLHEELVGSRQGRTSVTDQDLLRAAVVLLHAALEDLIRSIEEWKLPNAPAASLEELGFPISSNKEKEKMTVAELAAHRGKPVDWVIAQAIARYLEKSNYNHPGELESALNRAGLPGEQLVTPQRTALVVLMKRRHWIAHRADRNQQYGRGHYAAQSIGKAAVRSWLSTVDDFGQAVLAAL